MPTRYGFLGLLALLGAACGEVTAPEAHEPPPAVEQRSDAIINGTSLNSADTGFALLERSSGPPCTATLHTNYWLLTAKHCIGTYEQTYPHTVRLTMGGVTRRARQILLHPTEDVALLLVTEPFTVFGSDHSFLRPLYGGTAAGLNESVLRVYGYGYGDAADGGLGTLRYADLRVTSSASTPHLLQVQTTSGKQLAGGDSGGASIWRQLFGTDCAAGYLPGCIAGISITCDYAPGQPVAQFCTQLATSAFRDWFHANVRPTNAAAFVSQSVPTLVQAGQPFTVSITVRNTGSSAWEDYTGYRLGSQAPEDNNIWGAGGRVGLAWDDWITPGATKTFQFTAVAPNVDYTTTYAFQWRMLREHVEWFGEFTPLTHITVAGRFGDAPDNPCELDPSLCEPDICDRQPWKCPEPWPVEGPAPARR